MDIPFVSHIEWTCSDLDRSEQFFKQLFGWRFQRYSKHYSLYTPPQGTCVGLMQTMSVNPSHTCHAFITVENIRASLDLARKLKASVAVDVTEIANYGRYAQLTDPDGNLVGLFEAERPSNAR